MRVNLTKKEIINSVFMQIGFSKKMSESILEDILSDIVNNLKKYNVVGPSAIRKYVYCNNFDW